MKFYKSIDQDFQTELQAFWEKRLTDHLKIYHREWRTAHPELHRGIQREFDELISLLGTEHKDLLIDYTDHLNQKYFGLGRWFYERGLLDCQSLYQSIRRDWAGSRLWQSREKNK